MTPAHRGTAPSPLAVWIPPLLDLAVVTLFVVVGRRSHDEGSALAGFLRVWWPFAAGLGLSALACGAWWYPLRWARVAAMVAGTVVLGMLGRVAIQGRDFAPSFVTVTALFLAAGMFGWRLVARAVMRRRAGAPA